MSVFCPEADISTSPRKGPKIAKKRHWLADHNQVHFSQIPFEALLFLGRGGGQGYNIMHKLRPTKDSAEVHAAVGVEEETMKRLILAAIITLAVSQ